MENIILELDKTFKSQKFYDEHFFNAGIDKNVVEKSLKGLFPKVVIDESFYSLFEWHNGVNDSNAKRPHDLIFGGYQLLSMEDIILFVNTDYYLNYKKRKVVPLFSNLDGDVLSVSISEPLSIKSKLYKSSSWDSDYFKPVLYFDSVKSFFSFVITCYDNNVVYFIENGVDYDLDRLVDLEEDNSL